MARRKRLDVDDPVPFHPDLDSLPTMGADQLKSLAESIAEIGLLIPILRADGRIVDGRNRYKACLIAGVEPEFRDVEDVDDETVRSWISGLNAHRLHLNSAQRRVMIAVVLARDPSKSNRRLADQLGVDHKTIAAVRAKLEAGGTIEPADVREDATGRHQPGRRGEFPHVADNLSDHQRERWDGLATMLDATVDAWAEAVERQIDSDAVLPSRQRQAVDQAERAGRAAVRLLRELLPAGEGEGKS